MLYVIRERMQGWIAWAIVILLIVPFALWGIQEYFGGGGPQVVATVDGEKIHQRDYTQAVSRERDMMRQQLERMRQIFGEQYDRPIVDEEVKKQALDKLINSEVLRQNASDSGMRISNTMVVNRIKSYEVFQENGKFSPELYKSIISRNEGAAYFEQQTAREMLTQQLYAGLTSSVLTTQKDIDLMLRLQEQKRDLEFLTLMAADYKQESDATDEAIKTFYDGHLADFMNPEKVSVEYVELSAADLGKTVEPTEEQLQEFYKDRSSQFKVPAERRTSHILISVEEGADEAKIKAAKAKADDVRKQLVAGTDFAELAKKHSDDPGSSKIGGDIGFFGTGSLDPNYEKTMFALKKGELSEPVLSSFGYHIIKVTEIREEKSKSFDDVKGELAVEFKQKQANEKYFDMSDKLTTLAYEVTDTLTDAAAAAGLEIKESKLFTRSGIPSDKVFSHPKILKAAFSDEVLGQGYNSDPVELGEHHVVVLRIKEHVEKSQRLLEEAKADVKRQLMIEKAKSHVAQKGDELLKRLRAGENLEAVAKELKLSVKKEAGLKRTDRKIDSNIVKRVFQLTKPAQDKVSHDKVILPSGDYVLLTVTKVTEVDLAAMEQPKKTSTKRNLANMYGETDFDTMLNSLKEKASIVIQEDNL